MSFENVFSKEEIYDIGKYFLQNAGWYRVDNHDGKRAELRIQLPYDSELSSVGSRVDEMNKVIMEETVKRMRSEIPVGIMDCKRAYKTYPYDYEKAKEYAIEIAKNKSRI